MGSLIAALGFILAAPAILGQEFPREIRAEAGNPLYNHYRCRDGRWIAIAHLDPDRYWTKICKALGVEEITNDPRFNTIEARGKNAKELVALFDQRFAAKPRDEWMAVLKKEGCIFTPIQTLKEVTHDPQAADNRYFIEVEHPLWGALKMVGFPWDFSETPASWQREAPGLGQHTEEIMLGLGYAKNDIDAFRGDGVIS